MMIEPVDYLERIPSTNQYLLDWSKTIPTGAIKAIATFNQTNGRGQRGNSWLSEPGCNILYSLLFQPKGIRALDQFLISQSVSLIIKSFLNDYTGDISIKWPNDIYRKNKKIAGILIENQLTGGQITQSIVGIGINVNQRSFPANLPDATSLSIITGVDYNLKDLTDKLHVLLCKALPELTAEAAETIRSQYFNNLYHREGFHRFTDKNGFFSARICGITSIGHLMLELEEDKTVRSYDFKEVRFT